MERHDLTSRYIDFALEHDRLDSIALELPYFHFKRKADIILFSAGLTVAIEVKSKLDTLTSLRGQIEDYSKCFNSTYVLIDECHLPSVRSHITENTGIIVYSSGTFERIRKAKIKKRLNKWALVGFLSKKEISLRFKDLNIDSKFDTTESRKQLCSLVRQSRLQTCVYEYLLEKTQPSFEIFQKEKHMFTVIDDLLIISNRSY